MPVHLIGGKNVQEGEFIRLDGHSFELGTTIIYQLVGLNFVIVVSRNGVELVGRFPCVDRRGIHALQDMLNRAVRHHEHLKSFPIGQKQTTIPEILFEEEEAQRDKVLAAAPDDDRVM